MRLNAGMTDEGAVPKEPAKTSSRSTAIGCLVLAAVVIGIPVACVAANSGGGSDTWEPTASEARSVCEGWVKDKLKAPSTADFQDGDTTGGPTSYTITGTVDAENSFGAQIRSSWTCAIRYMDRDQKWHGSATVSG